MWTTEVPNTEQKKAERGTGRNKSVKLSYLYILLFLIIKSFKEKLRPTPQEVRK